MKELAWLSELLNKQLPLELGETGHIVTEIALDMFQPYGMLGYWWSADHALASLVWLFFVSWQSMASILPTSIPRPLIKAQPDCELYPGPFPSHSSVFLV